MQRFGTFSKVDLASFALRSRFFCSFLALAPSALRYCYALFSALYDTYRPHTLPEHHLLFCLNLCFCCRPLSFFEIKFENQTMQLLKFSTRCSVDGG